ncbi:hypothetical protein TcCL_Unassigned00552 [Trypanosoma cruzi]|nr:hypothetical protein TcCL_Unassigned00552 [Trypanosoma cruzi]
MACPNCRISSKERRSSMRSSVFSFSRVVALDVFAVRPSKFVFLVSGADTAALSGEVRNASSRLACKAASRSCTAKSSAAFSARCSISSRAVNSASRCSTGGAAVLSAESECTSACTWGSSTPPQR